MKFKVNAGALAKELARAMGAVEKKTTIPILGNVMLAAEDGRLRIETTDLEISYLGGVDAEVSEAGSVTILARKLADYVGKLHEGAELRFNLGDNLRAMLSCEKSKAQIAGEAAGAWPEMPTPKREIATVPARVLIGAFSRTAFAISSEQSRFSLAGALLEISGGIMMATATDGHRLSRASYSVPSDGKWKSIVPIRAMTEIVRIVEDEGSVLIGEGDNHLFFEAGNRRIIARKMSGNFPDADRSFPKSFRYRAECSGSELIAAVARITGWSNDEKSRRVTITFGDRIIVTASNDSGAGEEEVEGSCECEPTEIHVSATYLTQAVKACDGRIAIEFNDKTGAMRISPVKQRDGESLIGIVMPMRA